MGLFVLTDAKIWLAGFDLSGQMNRVALEYGAEELDPTAFGDTTRKTKGGLLRASFGGGGFWNGGANEIDDVLFGRIATADQPLSVSGEAGDDGEIAYSMLAELAEYNPGATLGELLAFDVSAGASGGATKAALVRGTIMHNATRTASGNGTARQLGSVSATQRLYAALHVFGVTGTLPTLDVIVQSDDLVGFASPTSRITFTQATARGAQWATPVAGAITDTWFRISYTIGGTAPSFPFVVVVAIL